MIPTGTVFNFLTVLGPCGKTKTRNTVYLCRCVCGNTKELSDSILKSLTTKSCGCYRREVMRTQGPRNGKAGAKKLTKHGEGRTSTRTTEYKTWRAMKQRCSLPCNPSYMNYGGRGIKVCTRWRESYIDFLADMGRKPGQGYSLDRIDVFGDYTPENCRWATAKQQAANKRNPHWWYFKARVQDAA